MSLISDRLPDSIMPHDEEPLSDEAIRGIEESLEDIRAGRPYTLEEARAALQAIRRRGLLE